ncbi:MAG TPA: sulfite exporter TauE/SafE family protein [Acetobacteraceae bacterium]|jgi:hypothetical protein
MDALAWYVLLGTLVAGFVQGLSGFAFGLVAMTVWAWVVSPQTAGPLVVFGSLVGQLLSLGTVRRGFAGRRVWPFVLGGCIGTPIGVAMLRYIDQTVFKMAVGLILVAYCPLMLCMRAVPRVTGGGRLADGSVGVVGGFMGGLGGLNGPAPTLWCALRGWSRHEQRAVFQTFSLCMQALTLAIYGASGLITRQTLSLFALVAPAMILPTLLGLRLYARFSETGFRRVVLILLSLSGIVLLMASVPRLVPR